MKWYYSRFRTRPHLKVNDVGQKLAGWTLYGKKVACLISTFAFFKKISSYYEIQCCVTKCVRRSVSVIFPEFCVLY